jgi:hypothetical protein
MQAMRQRYIVSARLSSPVAGRPGSFVPSAPLIALRSHGLRLCPQVLRERRPRPPRGPLPAARSPRPAPRGPKLATLSPSRLRRASGRAVADRSAPHAWPFGSSSQNRRRLPSRQAGAVRRAVTAALARVSDSAGATRKARRAAGTVPPHDPRGPRARGTQPARARKRAGVTSRRGCAASRRSAGSRRPLVSRWSSRCRPAPGRTRGTGRRRTPSHRWPPRACCCRRCVCGIRRG